MRVADLGEYCCQGGGKRINTSTFSKSELLLGRYETRELHFSPLGNSPTAPRVALVGITPGSQYETFVKNLRDCSVQEAAKRAAFNGAQKRIKRLLNSQGFAQLISLDLSGDLNSSPDILTTSLVKCCLMVDGSYKYKAPDIVASPEAVYCVENRFLADIRRYSTLEWVILFGDPGWEAASTIKVSGKTILEHIRLAGANVLKFPHFAQNYQQRAIFCLRESEEADYLMQNPKHQAYAAKARAMRSALLIAMRTVSLP